MMITMVFHPVSVALLRNSLMFGPVVNSVLNGAIISFYNMFGMLGLVCGSVPGISSALLPMVLPLLLVFKITLVVFIG